MARSLLIDQILGLKALSQKDVDLIASKLTSKTFKSGEFFLQEGQHSNYEAMIEEGIFRSYYHDSKTERIIEFSERGQMISDYQSFIDESVSKVNIQALTDARVSILSKESINELEKSIEAWDKLSSKFFEMLTVKRQKQFKALLTTNHEDRYKYLLQKKSKIIGQIPQYYIAQYVGVQPESLSRIRRRIANS